MKTASGPGRPGLDAPGFLLCRQLRYVAFGRLLFRIP